MQRLYGIDGGPNCAVNQVYYSLGARGVEYDLLPWQAEHDVATMAYCPLDQGRLADHAQVRPIAEKHGATVAQIALAWLANQPNVIPIPKSAKISRVRENVRAGDIVLDGADLVALDSVFPPTTQPVPLKTS